MLTRKERETLEKNLSNDTLAHTYQSFIKYLVEDVRSGIFDRTAYGEFRQKTMKKDITALAHAYLNGVFDFDNYWDKLQLIVGWDLMIQGIIEGNIKEKSNGEDHD